MVRHDPVQRLNDQHADELVDVARAFGGEPKARSARATSIDDAGIDLVVETGDGRRTTTRVAFATPASGARRRLAFRDLAQQAAEHLRRDG